MRSGAQIPRRTPHAAGTTATDKAIVERTFESINTLFCQHVAGYTGRDTTRRGRDVAERAVWSLAHSHELRRVVGSTQDPCGDQVRHGPSEKAGRTTRRRRADGQDIPGRRLDRLPARRGLDSRSRPPDI
ncbi:hypothetical protein BS329_41470 [Amycolatopsis coloradensis]|uniref:Uncharacterized protein n=1 Tax=Amycolatopsis coloradensis TaxID=76021 RepID=A0A1R0KD45_9PSEU|nr:hypothetical protein BS329_41470 [Amycolatopsis coloradensis]